MERERGPVNRNLKSYDETKRTVIESQKNDSRKPILRFLLQSVRNRMAVNKEKMKFKKKLRQEKSKLRKIRRSEKLRQKIGRRIIQESRETKL